jgi:hypothetical protein
VAKLWPGIVAVVSLVVAVASAAFSGLQWHDAREALLLSTRPHVDFDIEEDPDTPPVGIAITNAGPGPAVIKSIVFYVDRKPVADAHDAGINYAHLSKAELDYQELEPGDTLGVNDKVWLIRYRKPKSGKVNAQAQDKFADFVEQNLAIHVWFCSVIREDKCWPKCSTKGRCQ